MSKANFDTWESTAGAQYGNVINTYSVSCGRPMFYSVAANTLYPFPGDELRLAITPVSRSSRFLILASIALGDSVNNAGFRIKRGNTPIGVGLHQNLRPQLTSICGWLGSSTYGTVTLTGSYLDSPETTHEIIYNIDIMSEGGTIYFNRNPGWVTDDTNVIRNTAISNLTALELS